MAKCKNCKGGYVTANIKGFLLSMKCSKCKGKGKI